MKGRKRSAPDEREGDDNEEEKIESDHEYVPERKFL
jgi:hypothetical protein